MAMSTEDMNKLTRKLDSLGESEVIRLVAQEQLGRPGSIEGDVITHWLQSKKSEREIGIAETDREAVSIASEANVLARSANSTAKDALRIARQQKTTAIIAALAAIIAAIGSIVTAIITWLSKS